MPKFPTSQAQLYNMAIIMYEGLKKNIALFPKPPVSILSLNIKRITYRTRLNAEVRLEAELKKAVNNKEAALNALAEAMKQDIRYAENTVNFDDNKLKLIGWSARSKPHSLELPGQPLELKADIDDNGNIKLSWTKPVDGGAVSFYLLQKRIMPDGKWTNAASCFDTYLILKEQIRDCGFEYIVYAVNKAGKSISSNVSAVSFQQSVIS
jgi:hypothetical protein